MNNNTQIARISPFARLRAASGRLAHDRRGAGLAEYLLLVGVIAIAAISIFKTNFFDTIKGAAEGQGKQIESLKTN